MINNTQRDMKKIYESPEFEVAIFRLETSILSTASASGSTADMEIEDVDDLW